MRHNVASFRDDTLEQGGDLGDRLDPVVDKEYLPLSLQLLLDGAPNHILIEENDIGLDGETITGRSLDDRHIAQAEE